jgi:apolipoprotein N-acyltransferase
MDSRLNTRLFLVALAATALSGAALYLSQGLYPRWWAAWLAPLAVLYVAPRAPWAVAGGSALVAGVIGRLSMWAYYDRLQFPMWLQLATVILPAAAFCTAVALLRTLYRRGELWLAVLAFPAVMVTYEYLISLAYGTFGNTAYTQLNNLPVLQLGAIAGLWGVSFVVMLFPSMVAAMILSPAKARRRMLITFSLIFACTLAYGVSRLLGTPRDARAIPVGLAVSDLPSNMLPQKDPDTLQLLGLYAQQVKELSQRGARIVVLPEMTALVRESVSGQVDALFRQTARSMKVQILVGVLHVTPNGTFNEARLYSDSTADVVYRKHHLVPVVEGRTTPGTGISVV